MRVIMLGAPGAGKGTISTRMESRFGIPHIATGDIFRENIRNNTELGKLAKSYTEKGLLVPDEVTIKLMEDRLSKDDCKDGYALDGFPRTLNQAKGLEEVLKKNNQKIDMCILVDVDEEALIKRTSGRRVCSKCQEPYNIYSLKPKKEGICDKCGGELVQRKDDDEKVILDRIKLYHEETEPLIEYYKDKTDIKTVDGFDDLDEVLNKIKGWLGK